MEIKDLRNQIDVIDDQLVELYLKRMEIVAEIAKVKKEEGGAINVSSREEEIVARVTSCAPDDLKDHVKTLFSTIFSTSKNYQKKLNG